MSARGTKTALPRRWLIRAAGSAAFLALLFWLLPLEAIAGALKTLPLRVFVVVLALFLMAHMGAALKWRMLLGPTMPVMPALRAHYAGLAANLCLPGAVGGDAVRAGLAQAEMRDGARVAAVAAADRLIDMVALLTVSALGLVLSWSDGADGWLALQAAAVLGVILGLVVLLPKLLPLPWRLVPGLPGRGFADKLAASFTELGRRPMTLVLALTASTAVQTLLVLLAWWLAVAAGADVAAGHWIFAWPLAKIIAVLPVSLNGLGLREATLAAMLAPFGADPAVIVAAGLVWQAVLFAAGGLGALVLAMTGPGRALPPLEGKDVSK